MSKSALNQPLWKPSGNASAQEQDMLRTAFYLITLGSFLSLGRVLIYGWILQSQALSEDLSYSC